jgi:hypothetical protein
MRVPDDDCFRSPSVLTELDIYVFIRETFMSDLYHIDNKHIDLSDHEMFVAMRSIFFFVGRMEEKNIFHLCHIQYSYEIYTFTLYNFLDQNKNILKIKFDRSVFFFRVLRFPSLIKLTATM